MKENLFMSLINNGTGKVITHRWRNNVINTSFMLMQNIPKRLIEENGNSQIFKNKNDFIYKIIYKN